ncbi:MAG: response regulator transcription factor [Chloroflexi bacterium]|nr:response regulator transcription factor [Chloroflexota bacterium]
MTLKVLIVDDHKLFRQGLISLMRTREGVAEVIGEAATAQEAVELAERLQPDVVLMDIYMPNGDGLQATREIKRRFPHIAVVILTSSERDEHLLEAVRSEASGYLLKNLDADELFNVLEGISQGEAGITRAMASHVLKGLAAPSMREADHVDVLTEREIAVLHCVATGASNLQIADELVISVNTVKTHLRNILEKLQLDNRTQAATYAIEHGYVSPPADADDRNG